MPDFQAGYAADPAGVAESVQLCVETGVAGLSIEDATGDRDKPLYDLPLAVERIKAAREAIIASGADVLLTARAECFLVGQDDPLREAIRRLQAYSAAGADVLYAPGPTEVGQIEAIVKAVSPRPVNVLMSANTGLRVSDLSELGVRRISTGSSLSRAAWTGFIRAAKLIAREGSFAGFEGLASCGELNQFFRNRPEHLRRLDLSGEWIVITSKSDAARKPKTAADHKNSNRERIKGGSRTGGNRLFARNTKQAPATTPHRLPINSGSQESAKVRRPGWRRC